MTVSSRGFLAPAVVAAPAHTQTEALPNALLEALREARRLVQAAGTEPHAHLAEGVVASIDEALAGLVGQSFTQARSKDARVNVPAGDDVMSAVCHDLKDPLSAIVMGTTFLLRNAPAGEPGEKSRKMGEAVLRATKKMTALIDDLHELARADAGRLVLDRKPWSARDLVDAAMDAALQGAAAKNIRVEARVEKDAKEAVVLADRERLLRVFAHLTSNAIRHTPVEGSVVFGARLEEDRVCFSVSDSGAGVPKENVATLFDRNFHATRRARHGTGLGLAVVKALIGAHGGDASVRSVEGEGATFSFALSRLPGHP